MSDEILINGMPFARKAVLAMPDGAELWKSGTEENAKNVQRKTMRSKIARDVGDTVSILGTTADVTQLNAAAILALTMAFKSGDTFQKFRSSFMGTIESLVPATENGATVYEQAEGFLGAVMSGEIILTASLKGFPNVLTEMGQRSTGVAAILSQAAQAEA